MTVPLKPELARFVDEEVRAGHFSSATEVVEAALGRLMLDPPPGELEAGEIDDIRESLDQMRQGDVVEWPELAARLRKTHLGA